MIEPGPNDGSRAADPGAEVETETIIANVEQFAEFAASVNYNLTKDEAKALVDALIAATSQPDPWTKGPATPGSQLDDLDLGLTLTRQDIRAIADRLEVLERYIDKAVEELDARLDAHSVALDALKPRALL